MVSTKKAVAPPATRAVVKTVAAKNATTGKAVAGKCRCQRGGRSLTGDEHVTERVFRVLIDDAGPAYPPTSSDAVPSQIPLRPCAREQQTYGQDVLNLVLAKGYLSKLLENQSARQYVSQRHPDLMMEFESIIAAISLDQQQFSPAL
ncbi:hypothetical protein LJ655_08880 [Paraburkholderia sp. MMS20-SJTN17]|uniref:Uncharacterized protein n=1 Tax=Paraburkholderia translucens TaxID=2886945 RepID=A0ABS8KB60_9BURK|nr:hypothetical protein [Paraburkholderia sp. MMS20-SJTN17]MCC8402005.1 hypothetical protein [Paraburkholderia sp. MMS20-SJTN17]